MNREIKFRVWDGERMHFFALSDIHANEGEQIALTTDGGSLVLRHSTPGLYQTEKASGVSEPMQYTGLTDAEGQEIWEGDIVQGEPLIGEKQTSVIVYRGHGFHVKAEHFGWEGEGLWDWDNMHVIGNIFENPELTEQEAAQAL